jgi:signal transduction histidine kinase
MTAAITIPNPLPPALVALSGETLDLIASIEARACAITTIEDVAAMEAADALVAEAIKLDKAIEAERKRLKAPITALAEAVDMASSEARTPLLGIKQDLGRLILAFQQAENARREAERRRLAEEQARREAEAAAAREAQRKADEAAKAAAEDEDLPPGLDAPAPAPVVHVPEVLAPTYQEQQAAAPLKLSSVVAKKVRVVEIFDPALVPRELNGVPLWAIDAKQVEKLAKAGLPIPGVRVVEKDQIAAKGLTMMRCPPATAAPTLNQVLASLGYRTEDAPGWHGSKAIMAGSREVFRGCSFEVWAWLHAAHPEALQ